jgi:hypothetical protein
MHVSILLALWVLTPIRKYLRWGETIAYRYVRGDVTRKQFSKKLAAWYALGAVISYAGIIVFYLATGTITIGQLASITFRDLRELVDEEFTAFLVLWVMMFLGASATRWCYRRGLVSEYLRKRIDRAPKQKRTR